MYIPAELRCLVRERAQGKCKYCLLHEDDTPLSHQVDHIISIKHKGQTKQDNLALACLECNRYKGSDVAAFDPATNEISLLFNPRTQGWSENFQLRDVHLYGLTPSARATVDLLRLNDTIRIAQRQLLIGVGRYPPDLNPPIS